MKSLVSLMFCLLLAHAPCNAQVFATIDALSGTATITSADGTTAAAATGQKISRGQTVVTAAVLLPSADVTVALPDKASIVANTWAVQWPCASSRPNISETSDFMIFSPWSILLRIIVMSAKS